MSNQEKRQQSVRGVTGTTGTYEEDWNALFDADLIAAGAFNDRLRAWINAKLSSNYATLPDAMQAYAEAKSAASWSELGTFDPTS
jgi:hypothetical protein